MRRLLLVMTMLLVATGCARVAESSLQDVLDGTAEREDYVQAVVTDVRTAGDLLVELSSGQASLWATGFEERPGRGAQVWTAIVGEPTAHDVVGVTYPSAGALDPPEAGITPTGVIAVLMGLLLMTGALIAGVSSAILRMRPSRRCPHCGKTCLDGWITCAECGQSLPEQAPARRVAATVFSAAAPSTTPETDGPAIEDTQGMGQTRIFQRDN